MSELVFQSSFSDTHTHRVAENNNQLAIKFHPPFQASRNSSSGSDWGMGASASPCACFAAELSVAASTAAFLCFRSYACGSEATGKTSRKVFLME
jgi:hypothetical protein